MNNEEYFSWAFPRDAQFKEALELVAAMENILGQAEMMEGKANIFELSAPYHDITVHWWDWLENARDLLEEVANTTQ